MGGGTVEKVQVKVGDPMPEVLPVGAGGTMETVGMWMITISVLAGLASIYLFGRSTITENSVLYGSRIRESWSAANILIISASTLWSVGISWAVMRIGTALRWLEAIGKKHEITKG